MDLQMPPSTYVRLKSRDLSQACRQGSYRGIVAHEGLIVDDHPVFRDGFAALLQHAGSGTIVHQAGNVAEGLERIAANPDLDILMLDLFMPSGSGMGAIAEFSRARRDLPIVVLSSSEDPEHVRRALALGALGYVPKSASPHAMISAIQLVVGGDIYVPPLLLSAGLGSDAGRPEIDDVLTAPPDRCA